MCPGAHNSPQQRVVTTFWGAPIPAFLWEDTGLEPRGLTRRSEGKGELSSWPETLGDRATGDKLSFRKGPVRPQEETSGRQHNRNPGPCLLSRPRLPKARIPYSAPSSASGCSGDRRPLWALCLPPLSPMKMVFLTPRLPQNQAGTHGPICWAYPRGPQNLIGLLGPRVKALLRTPIPDPSI